MRRRQLEQEPVVGARTFSDVDELRAADSLWEVETHKLGRGPFRFDVQVAYSGGFHIASTHFDSGLRVCGAAPATVYTVGFPLARMPAFIGGKEFGEADVVVIPPGGDIDLTAPSGFGYLIGTVPDESFVVRMQEEWGSQIVRGTNTQLMRHRSLRARSALVTRWRRLLGRAMEQPESLRSPHAPGGAIETILESLADAIEPVTSRREDSGRISLAKRVERFLRANHLDTIDLHSLLTHFGVPARTLHQGFQDAFGATPKAYLNALRLNSARRDLRHPRRDDTVTSIALRWGFTHFGWFSAHYKRLFGESPSTTLGHARRRIMVGR